MNSTRPGSYGFAGSLMALPLRATRVKPARKASAVFFMTSIPEVLISDWLTSRCS